MATNQVSDKISMAGIGEKLRFAREKRGFTIDQAQKQTHIHSTVLVALEDGRCDEILTSTYVKSFLKKYSGYLGLDTKQVLDDYRSIHPEAAFSSIPGKMEEDKAGNVARFAHFIRPLAAVLIATFLIFLLGNFVANYLRRPKPGFVRTPSRIQAPAKKMSAAKNNAQNPAYQDKIILFQKPIPRTEQLFLTMKVKQQVLVQLKKDGVLLFRRILAIGNTENLKADNTINLSVARAEAVELTLNGRRLNIGEKGQIKDLEINRKGIRIK